MFSAGSFWQPSCRLLHKPPHRQRSPAHHSDCCCWNKRWAFSKFHMSHNLRWCCNGQPVPQDDHRPGKVTTLCFMNNQGCRFWLRCLQISSVLCCRCFFVVQLSFIRQTKCSLIICVSVWVFSMMLFPLLIFFDLISVIFVFALIPSVIFLLCPLGAFVSLPGFASGSAEGKRRIIATFVLLLINYSVTIVPPVSFLTFSSYNYYYYHQTQFFMTLFLLGPFMDLLLLVFMREGPVDKLLACLCCCKMETPAAGDDSRLSIWLQLIGRNKRRDQANEQNIISLMLHYFKL